MREPISFEHASGAPGGRRCGARARERSSRVVAHPLTHHGQKKRAEAGREIHSISFGSRPVFSHHGGARIAWVGWLFRGSRPAGFFHGAATTTLLPRFVYGALGGNNKLVRCRRAVAGQHEWSGMDAWWWWWCCAEFYSACRKRAQALTAHHTMVILIDDASPVRLLL